MRKILLVLAVMISLVLFPSRSLAQTDIVIDELRIMIWPEYDQPSVLVFYAGQVSPGSGLPADLAFTLPDGATLNAAAYLDDQTGNLLLAQTNQVDNVLTVESPNGDFHVEFYDPSLTFAEDQRSYTLSFTSGYAINNLIVEFQHPAGATNIVTTPANGAVSIDQVGLQSTVVEVGIIEAQTPLEISMSYAKSTSALSVQALNPGIDDLPVQEPAVVSSATSPNPSPLMIGAGIGIVLLLAVGTYLWQSGRLRPAAARRRKAGPRRSKPAPDSRFCTNCGSAVDRADRFCRNCGTALRPT